MKDKAKWVFWGFLSLDYKAMEDYLENMAAQGWFLDKIVYPVARFKAIEPQRMQFTVDVFREGGAFAPDNFPAVEEYRQLCRDSGWKFITSASHLQFFYAPEGTNPTPIQTDQQLEQKIVASSLWWGEFGKGHLLLMGVLLIASYVFLTRNHLKLLTFMGVAGYLFPALAVYMFAYGMYLLLWLEKTRRRVIQGLGIKGASVRSARLRVKALFVPVIVLCVLFIAAMLADWVVLPYNPMLSIVPVIPVLIIVFGARYLKKNLAKSKKQSMIIGVSALLIAMLIVPYSVRLLASTIQFEQMGEEPYGENVLTLDDLIGCQGNRVAMEFHPGRSPVVPRHYDYWEVRALGDESVSLRVKYYRTISGYFARQIFEGTAESVSRREELLSDTSRAELWDVERVMISGDESIVLIINGNKVLYLEGDIDWTKEQVRGMINQIF